METTKQSHTSVLLRVGGIVVGCATQVLFLITVWHLFWFLKDGRPDTTDGLPVLDVLLALQFAIPHSLLLLPGVKKRLLPWITQYFYGSFYCVATCVSLLTLFYFWQGSEPNLWDLHGVGKIAVWVGFGLSWIALFYSLSLTGLGYQTGLTEWVTWLRRQPLSRRVFRPRGVYHLFRHPVYLSFLGLIWFTPRMSLDHALLTGIWTVYIFAGSVLKDKRLAYYLGDEYRTYAQHVRGYPLLGFGPLARWTEESTEPLDRGKTTISPSRRVA